MRCWTIHYLGKWEIHPNGCPPRRFISRPEPDTRDAALDSAYNLIDRRYRIDRITGPTAELSGEEVHRLYDAQDRWILSYRSSWPGSRIETRRYKTREAACSAAYRLLQGGGWQILEITGPGEPVSGDEIHRSYWNKHGGLIPPFGA
jgi:hypothetical protein